MEVFSKFKKKALFLISGLLLVFNVLVMTNSTINAKNVSDQNYRIHISGVCPDGSYWASCTNDGHECSYFAGSCFGY